MGSEKEPLGMSELGCADGCGRRGWVEMGREKEPLGLSELGWADGCGRRGCKGVGAAGDERAWEKESLRLSELGCADGCGRRGCKGEGAAGDERTAADGVGAREWVEMDGEKEPLGMSELGCADRCGEMGSEKEPLGMSELGCADGCGRRGCKGVGGNGWGEGAAVDERAWMRGRLRTAWVQGSGWKCVGRRSCWASSDARTGADGVVEMGGEKEPLGELGCADECGRRGCKGVGGNGWGEEAVGDE
eukprot:s1959_g10.t1